MKFHYLPKGDYKIGQVVDVAGQRMRVESYSHTGRNLVAVSMPGAKRFERAVIILTDAPSIEGVTA